MKPSVVLLGIVLGSSAAITFSLVGLAVIYFVLGPEYPRLQGESGTLAVHLSVFTALTAVSGVSFYGQLLMRRWRHWSVAALVVVLAFVAAWYWPA
jgi:hypothetical protein